VSSADAVLRVKKLSEKEVYNVRGGLQAWVAAIGKIKTSEFGYYQFPSGEIKPLPFRESSLFLQWVAVIAGFVIKPIYMLLSIFLIVALRKQKPLDLVFLRWGLISFLLGEAACSVNYIFFNEQSLFFEYLHSIGMVFSFSFVGLALIEGVDDRIIKFSDPNTKCSLVNLCPRCTKYSEIPCALKKVFELIAIFLLVLTFIPLSARTLPVSYNTVILGTFYNYTHAGIHQLYEIRSCPLIAITLFFMSWIALRIRSEQSFIFAKIFFGVGVGHLVFSIFRLLLLSVFNNEMVWFVFWEEFTELMFMVSVGWILWIFRDRLLKDSLESVPLIS
jgi:hypothetical protein